MLKPDDRTDHSQQPSVSNNANGHEFDLAQLELQKRQLQKTELRQTKKSFLRRQSQQHRQSLHDGSDPDRASVIRSILSNFVHKNPINVEPTKNGVYLGMQRRSQRDPTRYFEGSSTWWQLSLSSPLRNQVIDIIDSIYFELFILSIILINSILIAVDNPLHQQSPTTKLMFKVCDALFLVIYTVEMVLKMVGMGVLLNGPHSYLKSAWNVLDFLVVMMGYVEFLPMVNNNFASIRSIRVLRPLRSINSVPGLKVLVSSLLNSLSMMGNVLLLFFFLFLFFGLLGMQLFAGKLQQRCYNPATQQFVTDSPYLCGSSAFQCAAGEECLASGANPNYGITGFDNILYSWLTVLSCISLEGWIDVAYHMMETTHPASILFFVVLIFFGSFIVINLVVGVIVNAYDLERTKQRNIQRKLEQVQSSFALIKNAVSFYRRSAVGTLVNEIVGKSAKIENEKSEMNEKEPEKANLPAAAAADNSADVDESKPKMAEEEKDKSSDDKPLLSPAERREFERSDEDQDDDEDTPSSAWSSYLLRIETACFNLAESKNFNASIIALIVLNTIVLACEYENEPSQWVQFQEIANYAFTTIFMLEVMIKCCGYGFQQYFQSEFNRFDFVITILNLIEIVIVAVLDVDGFGGLSVFRSFRLIKVFRLARSWTVLRDLLKTVGMSLNSLVYFSVVLLLFMFIYSLLGIQFFAGKMYVDAEKTEVARSNFDTFWWSLVTVFQVVGGENWNDILYLTVFNTHWMLGAAFCVSLYVLGNYVMLNLFLAILLSNFETSDNAAAEAEAEAEAANENVPTVDRRDSDGSLGDASTNSSDSVDDCSNSEELYIDSLGFTLRHRRTRNVYRDIKSLFRAQKVEIHDRSLLCLSDTNKLRTFCSWLVQQSFFEFLVLVTICYSCVILIFEEPGLNPDSQVAHFLEVSEIICTVVFCVEAGFKIIANGLYFTSSAYLKNSWNLIDCVAILFSILDLGIGQGEFAFLRVVRAFRALRIIRRIEGMKVVLIAMLQSIKPVINVLLISCLFYVVFGILGVQLFKGQFAYCQNVDGEDLGVDRVDCDLVGGSWRNPAFGNFDHIGSALFILFDISTLEMWPNIMYRAVDTTEIGLAPKRDNRPHYALYFILFIICTNFFIMNLFVGVVVDHFNSAKNRLEGGFLTPQQQQWVYIKRWISSTATSSESNVYRPPTSRYYNDSDDDADRQIRDCNAAKTMIAFAKFQWLYRRSAYLVLHKWRRTAFNLVTSPGFEYFIMCCIVFNVLVELTWSYGQPYEMELLQWLFNKLFAVIFALEMCLKLYGLGTAQYFSSVVNLFDFVIVCGSLIGLAFGDGLRFPQRVENGASIGFDPTIFRVFRILRLLRLVNRAKKLKLLIQTLIYALPSLSNIGWLLLLIFFIYAILGMGLFGGTPYDDTNPSSFLNKHCNFDTFANSLITLFRVATGESWNGVARQLLPDECTFMNGGQACGTYAAPFYFISFVVAVAFIILNVFIAIILEQFQESFSGELADSLSITKSDVEAFDAVWCAFVEEPYKWYRPSNDGHLWCNVQHFELILTRAGGCFGFRERNWTKSEKFQFMQNLQIPLHRRYTHTTQRAEIYVQYYQVLLALALQVMTQRHGSWIQSQIIGHTKFAKAAIHRQSDWNIAKKLLKTQCTAIDGVTLIQIIAAIKIQASIRGYLCRKTLRNEWFR